MNNDGDMKNIIKTILLFTCILFFPDCTGEKPDATPPRVEVSFSALSLKSDSDINAVSLLVFRSDGSLDAFVHREGHSLTASLLKGETLRYYLLANAPESLMRSVADEQTLNSLSVGLPLNERHSLVMLGKGEGSFDAPRVEHVTLDRLVCKVSLGNLIASFAGAGYLQGARVVLDRVYLLNVTGGVTLDLSPSAEKIYNVGVRDTSLPAALADLLDHESGIPLDSPSAVSLDLQFYCCPNPSEDTRLVLELSIGGEKNYYPLTLPAMECNKEYRAETVELLSWGSASPDVPVDRKSVDFEVKVADWGVSDDEYVLN